MFERLPLVPQVVGNVTTVTTSPTCGWGVLVLYEYPSGGPTSGIARQGVGCAAQTCSRWDATPQALGSAGIERAPCVDGMAH